MIDKQTGQVADAIMSFGGFLGIGNSYHPLPWSLLQYDTTKEGYVVNLDKTQLEGAPAYDVGVEPDWDDPEYETEIHDYYGVGPYWGAPRLTHPASPIPCAQRADPLDRAAGGGGGAHAASSDSRL